MVFIELSEKGEQKIVIAGNWWCLLLLSQCPASQSLPPLLREYWENGGKWHCWAKYPLPTPSGGLTAVKCLEGYFYFQPLSVYMQIPLTWDNCEPVPNHWHSWNGSSSRSAHTEQKAALLASFFFYLSTPCSYIESLLFFFEWPKQAAKQSNARGL